MPLHKSIQFSFLSVFEWQIYAEAESNARGQRRMQTCLREAEDFCIAEAIQYM